MLYRESRTATGAIRLPNARMHDFHYKTPDPVAARCISQWMVLFFFSASTLLDVCWGWGWGWGVMERYPGPQEQLQSGKWLWLVQKTEMAIVPKRDARVAGQQAASGTSPHFRVARLPRPLVCTSART